MEVTIKTVKAIIKQYSGQEQMLGIPRPFIKLTGDHLAALVLSQIVFWSDKGDDEEGWFYKTAGEWESELCISYYQLKRVTDILAKFGIEKKLKKVNGAPTLHFRINETVFYKLLVQQLEIEVSRNSRNSKFEKPEIRESAIPDIEETQISEIQETQESSKDTTNTTTITSEITTEADASSAEKAVKPSSKKRGGVKSTGRAAPDARTSHPAIQACRNIASQYPPIEVYDEIIEAIGGEPDIERLTDCRKSYVLAGKNRNGWTWVTDWYVNGIPEWHRKNGNGKDAVNGKHQQQPTANGMGPRAATIASRNYEKWGHG